MARGEVGLLAPAHNVTYSERTARCRRQEQERGENEHMTKASGSVSPACIMARPVR